MSDDVQPKADGKELVRRILPLMSQHTDDFRPKSYALWYAYTTGSNPELSRHIDQQIGRGARLSSDVTFELYDRYLIEQAESRLGRAQGDLLDALARTREQMDSADSETSRFQQSLDGFGEVLGTSSDLAALAREVSSMAGETSRASRAIGQLLAQVRESQAEVARLSLELTRAKDQANTDPLTGLANRGAFDNALRRMCERRGDAPLSLIMLDIDHFKRINDTYGHPFGDVVIRSVAAAIHGYARGRDVAARYGGEEFAVLMVDTSEQAAAEVAERIRDQIERSRIRDAEGRVAGAVTISAGVAQHLDREVPEGLLGRSDRALYRSKAGGRNRVTLAA